MAMDENPRSTAKIASHPLHPMLIPFPVAFFIGALACDLAYWRTGDIGFAVGSAWLIGAGLVMAALAALAGLTDFLGSRRIRRLRVAWLHMAGNVIVVGLEALNLFLRQGDPGAGVVPDGLILSLAVTLLLLFTGWLGWEMVYRHRVGVADTGTPR